MPNKKYQPPDYWLGQTVVFKSSVENELMPYQQGVITEAKFIDIKDVNHPPEWRYSIKVGDTTVHKKENEILDLSEFDD